MTETVSYRNQSIDLLCKSMDWFLDDNGLRHERVKYVQIFGRVMLQRKLFQILGPNLPKLLEGFFHKTRI